MDAISIGGKWGSESLFPNHTVCVTVPVQILYLKVDIRFYNNFIRWSALRATEGWAALQYHSVLRTSITLSPPLGLHVSSLPRLHVRLVQGSFFCVIPVNASKDIKSGSLVPKWYSGNIYDLEQAPPQIIDLPVPPSAIAATTYDIFVSGDYEVVFQRLFV